MNEEKRLSTTQLAKLKGIPAERGDDAQQLRRFGQRRQEAESLIAEANVINQKLKQLH